jgi:MSHA biogenesis protein MshO
MSSAFKLRGGFQSGFTLVELVVVIVLSTIVVGFATMFMTTPIDAYFASSRRAELVDTSEAITRRLSADLRSALPNSVRISNVGTRSTIEMMTYSDVAFYRTAAGTTGPSDVDSLLLIGGNDSKFSSIGRLKAAYPGLPRPLTLSQGWRIAINPQNVPVTNAGNVYATTNNVISQYNNQVKLTFNALEIGEDRVELANAIFKFNSGSASNRMFLVSGAVTYMCNSAAKTLRRFSNYTPAQAIPANESAAQLVAAGATNVVVANNVASCLARCVVLPGTGPMCQNGIVTETQIARTNAPLEPLKVYLQEQLNNST